jgi:hypothetical protein
MSFVRCVQHKLAFVCLRLSVLPVLLAGLLLPVSIYAQVTYTGTTASQNFGSVNVGSPSTVSLSFNVAGTIGSVEVVTQGAPNLDFTDAGTGSCTSGSTSACTVNATFTPIYAGLRRGAVLFWSGANNSGSVIGKTFVYGVGNGGQIIYGTSPVVTSISNGLGPWNNPAAVTADGAGNLYVADAANWRIV